MTTEKKDDFFVRVNYIVMCLKKGTTGGKRFIESFTKGDSEFIITRLIQLSVRDEELDKAVRSFAGGAYISWMLTASEYYELNRNELKRAAKEARNKNNKK